MAKLDERGSKLQHEIYNLTCKAYPIYDVVYEYPIGELGQRIDIFIPLLGIAIEIDGIQHFEYNKFFFKDANAWNNSVRLDKMKDKYLVEKGVKLIRIPYNTKIKTVEELKELIDSVDFPDVEYEGIEVQSEYSKIREETEKQKRKEYAKKTVDKTAYENYKLKRKENYKQQKERQKALKKRYESENKGIVFLDD